MLLHLFAAISVSCLLIIIAGKAKRPKVNIKCVSILKAERQEILALKKKWFYALGWGKSNTP